jgi:hypothetical protein
MGREIVYCWKCATRMRGEDFDNGDAFKVGDKVSCAGCVDELVADLSAEEQEAILAPPRKEKTPSRPIKKISSTSLPQAEKTDGGTGTSRRTGTVQRTGKTTTTGAVQRVRTGTTGPVPTVSGGTTGRNTSTGVRKKVTASIPKVQPPDDEGGEEGAEGDEKPPMDEKKKKILLFGGIGGGLFLIIAVLLILVLTKKPPPKAKTDEVVEDSKGPKVTATTNESPKEKEIKALLKAAFDLKTSKPDALGEQLKKFREAEIAAGGTALAADIATAIDDVLAKLDKAIAAVGDQVKQQYSDFDFKTVLDTYEKAKALHDVPEWTERIDTKIKLTRNRVEDTFHQFKRQIEDKTQAGEDAEIEKKKAIIAKWEMPEYVEKFDRFVALVNTGTPEPGKNPPDPTNKTPVAANIRQLTPAMKAFMPAWQSAIALAFSRDYAAAVTEMTGAAARAESDEAKKAGTEDVALLKALGDRYAEILKTAAETPNLATLTLEYQDKPGEWKKVTGKTVKVQPTRMEFQPDPVDKKPQPAIFIEFTDLNAGSLATLYKARKKTLPKADADLLAKFALIEGAAEAAQAIGAAPDRFWVYAAEAREKAPKPQSREFEARSLFHQSEFEWRKSITRYNAIEKSKLLMSDYTTTAIVKRYQAAISKRAETGKEFVFLPSDLVVNGDYNTFKAGKKEDPMWLASKQIDFKDSLYNFVEAEFIALPGLTYKCWVYAGGCCQEVWNGSYQATEMTTKNKGKDVPIDPGVQMAAPLPMPIGLKKTHEDHKPSKKGAEHPKNPAKWDWIQIPLPKTFLAPGAKSVRILTDQQGFAVKYVIISSSRPKSPDDATAKELAKEALSAPAPKLDVKGEAQPKQWFIIGPFSDGLASEQPPEKEIELGKAVKGKNADVKWKLANATMSGQQAVFDWDKNNAFNPKTNVAVYALIHVKAPAAMDARLFISHDDGGRAWLNGTKVHDNDKSGGGAVKADEFNVAIKLEEGWNRLLIKVNQGTGGFGLMMRITDPAKAAIAGLEYSPYGDSLEQP